jgi:DNA polymerase-3 subunit delta
MSLNDMAIYILTGCVREACAERVRQQKQEFIDKQQAKLDPNWVAMNVHFYSTDELQKAIFCFNTPAFCDKSLIVCSGSTPNKTDLEIVTQLNHTSDNIFIFNLDSLDGRSAVAKHLKQIGEYKQFESIPNWEQTQLNSQVESRAKALGIKLPPVVVQYIASAVGNDLGRMQKELEKLVACRGEETLTLAEVKLLIPNLTDDAFGLAKAILDGNTGVTYQISHSLLDRNEPPLKIVGGIIYKFLVWLKFKAAIDAGITDNKLLAKASGVGNPKQCYFLRQQVAPTNTQTLARVTIALFDLQCQLKQGMKDSSLPYYLIAIASF